MIILSWNIEHMRLDKITRSSENFRMFYQVLCIADIAFTYEGKDPNTAEEVCELLNQSRAELAKQTGSPFRTTDTFHWQCGAFNVGLGECVHTFWKMDKIKTVSHLKDIEDKFKAMNLGERYPACYEIETLNQRKVRVGAWHCAGPAVTLASSVKGRFQNIDGLHYLFGDLNFQAPPPDDPAHATQGFPAMPSTSSFAAPLPPSAPSIASASPAVSSSITNPQPSPPRRVMLRLPKMREMHAVGLQSPSTFSPAGAARRWTGPIDRVFAAGEVRSRTKVFQYRAIDPKLAIALTNHVPIIILINVD